MITIIDDKTAILTILLEEKIVDRETPNEHGVFPLGVAAGNNRLEAMRLLHAHGARTTQCNGRGSTAAHVAAFHGRIKALDLLLTWAPELLNAQDYIGRTPFFWATVQKQYEAAKHLIEEGADLTLTFINGQSTLNWLKSENAELYEIHENHKRKQQAIAKLVTEKKKKKKKNRSGKTFNQRAGENSVAKEMTQHKELEEDAPIRGDVEPIDPIARAAKLNDLLVHTDDGSKVLSDDGKAIEFGYKHMQYVPTDLILCLRTNVAPSGPRLVYHERVSQVRQEFIAGAKDDFTIEHTQPEALERMHGHCILGMYTDKKGRKIRTKILFGKKLIHGEWIEGFYTLGFSYIRGEYMCFHSFFVRKKFEDAMRNIEIDEDEREHLEAILDRLTINI